MLHMNSSIEAMQASTFSNQVNVDMGCPVLVIDLLLILTVMVNLHKDSWCLFKFLIHVPNTITAKKKKKFAIFSVHVLVCHEIVIKRPIMFLYSCQLETQWCTLSTYFFLTSSFSKPFSHFYYGCVFCSNTKSKLLFYYQTVFVNTTLFFSLFLNLIKIHFKLKAIFVTIYGIFSEESNSQMQFPIFDFAFSPFC